VLESFRGGADDLLRRFCGLRLSAATVRAATEAAGAALARGQQAGAIVRPEPAEPWDFRLPGREGTAAFVGLDAFSVPMQQPGGGAAEGRMLYTAVLYTPDKRRGHYLVDFDLDRLAGQLRQAAIALGLSQAGQVVAITDGGNGIEAALRRHLWDDLPCVLDWYHACQHLHAYAQCRSAGDAAAAARWAGRARDLLYERGGTALLGHLRRQRAPADPAVADELRKLVGYFADNEHRTDYRRTGGGAGTSAAVRRRRRARWWGRG
jgi:hypothetical protein